LEISEFYKVFKIDSGDRTIHTYSQVTAEAIATNIKMRFFALFVNLQMEMQKLSVVSDDAI
jgi:hypothetical protein